MLPHNGRGVVYALISINGPAQNVITADPHWVGGARAPTDHGWARACGWTRRQQPKLPVLAQAAGSRELLKWATLFPISCVHRTLTYALQQRAWAHSAIKNLGIDWRMTLRS